MGNAESGGFRGEGRKEGKGSNEGMITARGRGEDEKRK